MNAAMDSNNMKKSFKKSSQSLSVETNKIDFSLPRKYNFKKTENFKGLGIHISCNPVTQKSCYIHEIDSDSPCAYLCKKGDFILEINGHDAVNMDFYYVINEIKSHVDSEDLVLTVGTKDLYKKWTKQKNSSVTRKLKLNISTGSLKSLLRI
jgi:C-terminal processing protease CtpA/Prc